MTFISSSPCSTTDIDFLHRHLKCWPTFVPASTMLYMYSYIFLENPSGINDYNPVSIY